MLITDRDEELLLALARSVRALTFNQVRAHFGWKSVSGLRRRLRRLSAEGLITTEYIGLYDWPEPQRPLANWQPHMEKPDLANVARQVGNRWRSPSRLTPVFLASAQCCRDLGTGRVRTVNRSDATHDLYLSEVYLRWYRCDPHWRIECDLSLRSNESNPDALTRANGKPTAIEVVGKYTLAKLERFHADAARKVRGYVLW